MWKNTGGLRVPCPLRVETVGGVAGPVTVTVGVPTKDFSFLGSGPTPPTETG